MELLRFSEIMDRLGLMGYPLLIASAVALALVVERTLFLVHHRPRTQAVRQIFTQARQNGEEEVAIDTLKAMPSPLAHMASSYLHHWEDPVSLRHQCSENAARRWLNRARGPVKTLSMLAHIAPLLGLTGTVLGLVETFRVIQAHERTVEPALLAGGIWEALLTTVVGMAICIPIIVAVRLFNSRLDAITQATRDLFNWLEVQHERAGQNAQTPSPSASTERTSEERGATANAPHTAPQTATATAS